MKPPLPLPLTLSHCFPAGEMSVQRGDDLEDDFVPDDLVALSGEEDAAFDPRQGAGDNIDGLLSADEEAEQDGPAQATSAKRKRREKDKERQAKVTCTVPRPTTL